MACTYDIHPRGARLLSSRPANIGDLVMVERARNKAVCQVVWAADASSALRGQFAVQCVEGRTPWDEELRLMEEQYEPIDPEGAKGAGRGFGRPEGTGRGRPRFFGGGPANVRGGGKQAEREG